VKAQDYIAILESVDFEGGIYKEEYAETILNAIFAKSGVPFVLADEFKQEKLSGYIPYTNCRKALQQVLIAIGGYARTAYSEVVGIVKSSENAVSNIPLQKIYEGQNVEVNSDVTEVEIFAHKYTVTDNKTIIFTASEVEENLKVVFSEPMHSLWVENGKILEHGTNYAIINCDENGVLNGRKYEHSMVSKTKRNTSATSKSANKRTIRDATLVSAQNVDKVLNLCYNSIVKNTEIRAKVVEDNEPYIVGNTYSIDTEMIGNVKGVLLEQNFNLYGGAKVAKEMVIK
jgi:hypothetical protein